MGVRDQTKPYASNDGQVFRTRHGFAADNFLRKGCTSREGFGGHPVERVVFWADCARIARTGCPAKGGLMRLPAILFAIFSFFVSQAWSDEQHQHALTGQEIGSVHFSTSCSKAVESSFNGAVALLHSFQYERARQAFAEISGQDPKCAMAQWGVAMSHYHGLWDNGDMAAGADALPKAKEIAAANAGTTAREIAYIDTLVELYREDGTRT